MGLTLTVSHPPGLFYVILIQSYMNLSCSNLVDAIHRMDFSCKPQRPALPPLQQTYPPGLPYKEDLLRDSGAGLAIRSDMAAADKCLKYLSHVDHTC